MKDKLKKWLKINFDLNFTSSKLLGYIIVSLGTYVSLKLKIETPFSISVIAAVALFGAKMYTDGKSNKGISDVIENTETKIDENI